MAEIRPFRAVRFAPSLDLARVVTQPYDKIPPDLRRAYKARDPHNLVNLILPDEAEAHAAGLDKYAYAADQFQRWLRNGVLACDDQPSLYPYRQSFEMFGEQHVRGGFIGLLHVEPYSQRIVFPHEKTLAKPKADRLSLLRAGRVHYGLIFLLYEDDGHVQALLDNAMQMTPVAEVKDDFAVRNELWRLSDAARLAAVQQAMADKAVFIADGHHRYETSLAYAGEHPQDAAAQFTMAMFVNIRGPLVILPTHRSIHGLADYSPAQLRAVLQQQFDVCARPDLAATLAATRAASGSVCIGVCDAGGFATATLRDAAVMRQAAPERGAAWRGLDVAVLHTLIIERALGISAAHVEQESGVQYHRDPAEAVARVHAGDAQCAFFLRPTAAQQVCDVARHGDVMPQKSTDFYPKLLSGLTLYALDEQH
jgi:uncharacterized protein (DUF1015 family)